MLLLLLLEDFPLAPLAPPLEAEALAEEGPAFGCSFTIVPTAAPKPAPLPKPTMFCAGELLCGSKSLQVLPSFVTAPDHVLADAQPMAILSLSLDTCFDGRELLTKYIRTSAEQVSENGSTSAVAWHSFAHDFCCFFMLFYALPPGRLSDRCFFLACTFGQRHGHRPWGCQPKLARWTRLDSPGSP